MLVAALWAATITLREKVVTASMLDARMSRMRSTPSALTARGKLTGNQFSATTASSAAPTATTAKRAALTHRVRLSRDNSHCHLDDMDYSHYGIR